MAEKTCLTCKHAQWSMTKHRYPQIIREMYGRCELPDDRVLDSVNAAIPKSFLQFGRVSEVGTRQVIWPQFPHVDCPTWEARG